MIANCQTTLCSLARFLDGALTAAADHALRDHLAICPRCTEFLQSYRATARIARVSTDVTLPAGVEERLLARLEKEK